MKMYKIVDGVLIEKEYSKQELEIHTLENLLTKSDVVKLYRSIQKIIKGGNKNDK